MKQSFEAEQIRQDFPILKERVQGHSLVYLDNAATSQKPRAVIEAMIHYYQHDNANIHRGLHTLSARATEAFELARATVQRFINAPSTHECIFVRGTTEAINLVAHSYALPRLKRGDAIVLSTLEHHSNIVPWQIVCQQTGAHLKIVPISPEGEVLMEAFEAALTEEVVMVAISYASNAIGTINPVKEMCEKAQAKGVVVLVDGAQATPHLPIDVQDLGCDFFAFSGHKVFGPTGIGVLWGKAHHLEAMPPYQGGGEMIRQVSFEATDYAPLPHKFEAGTPDIAGAIGLGAAIDYLDRLDMDAILAYEAQLLAYATEAVRSVKGFRVVGTAAHKVPVVSFVHETIHAHDIGTIFDSQGIAIRSGHHCAMPLMTFFNVPATSRISLAFYNTHAEIDKCVTALHKACEVFA